jgi:YidC/Oxa1 family membrane protein insertase
VLLNINNNTANEVKLNTCKDIIITNSTVWEKVVISPSFCRDLAIKPKEHFVLDYASEYNNFKVKWDYIFKINYQNKEFSPIFKIENKWTISKLFTSLFYAPIYNLMIFLVDLFSMSLWWAIIAITIIIRLVLLWPQHKMMLSQKKLQNIQPKIKKIQEEHKWNQQVIGMKLMELYKEEKVNPMWSCGFMLIQMPILIVIYNIILNIKDPSNHFYLYSFISNFDFTKVSYDFFWVDLLWVWWTTWLVLAIVVWIVQYIQVKLSLAANKAKDKDKEIILEKKQWEDWYNSLMPDPEMMNKFMLYGMPWMVWVFTYSLIAWVGIYWVIWTSFMIVQQIVVNKVLKK